MKFGQSISYYKRKKIIKLSLFQSSNYFCKKLFPRNVKYFCIIKSQN